VFKEKPAVKRPPNLSVIMPALNEEENVESAIRSTLAAFEKHGISGEVLLINDGSTDKTREIVERACAITQSVRLINHDTPQGIGRSFWDGVKNAKGDVVVLFPADNEIDPDDMLQYFWLMKQVDMLVPFFHNTEVRHRGRRIISSLYRLAVNMSFGTSLNYTNGSVFYRRSILDHIELNSAGFFYQVELLVKLIRKGYLFAEVPSYLGIRTGGKAKAITLKSFLQVVKGYFRLIFDIHLLKIEGQKKDYFELSPDSATFQRADLFQSKFPGFKRQSSAKKE
jgi:glycosyltransferase involved in cell wall biosynthesis